MSKQDFEDGFFPPEPAERDLPQEDTSVDFSDLGPLFSAPFDEEEEKTAPEQETEPEAQEEEYQVPQVVLEDEDLQDLADILKSDETEAFDRAQQEEEEAQAEEAAPEAPEVQPEAPIYQAPDYPGTRENLDDQSTVMPGEAAWLLQKLRELPPDPDDPYQPREEAEEPELPQEEEVPESPAPEQEETVSEEEPEIPVPPVEPQTEEEPDPEEAPEEVPLQEPEVQEPVTQEVPPQEPPKKRIRKGRPKRKKGEGFFGIPNLAVTVVWIAITVLIGVTLGRMVWVCAADVLAFGREDKPVTVTIYESDTIDDITQKLYDAELIHYPGLFKFYASLAVDEGEIHPGIWDLNTRYDYHALVNMMSPNSSRDVVEVMIPEGYSCRQIFALMEEKKICTALDLASYAAAGELDEFWFLQNVERGDMYCLEGFLFPDTYQFYKNDSPRNVLQKMLVNFETKFNENMIAQIDALNGQLSELMRRGGHGDEFIANHQFDIRDVITVASLIEKETSSAEEGYTIASVIYNRLYNWGDNPAYLNIDASIVYALGGKTDLTQEDLKVDSPYNTYLNTGLTPGPIANPGLASIQAALQPQNTNYYFYVLDPATGSHRFTSTYDEHQAAVASVGG